jgi:hypothetical protein
MTETVDQAPVTERLSVTSAARAVLCVLCVGEPDGCPRCKGTGTDPDPLAPRLDGAT